MIKPKDLSDTQSFLIFVLAITLMLTFSSCIENTANQKEYLCIDGYKYVVTKGLIAEPVVNKGFRESCVAIDKEIKIKE